MEDLSGDNPEIAHQPSSEKVEQTVEWAQERWDAINDRARTFVKQHPVASLLGAAAVGYLAARALARR
ncbi:MAG TPA: hypothetical protein VKN99_15445 [Polyangia bacterium]|nr:hypothetical protein [Polyangia bacterium]